jgi:hypothetical protein
VYTPASSVYTPASSVYTPASSVYTPAGRGRLFVYTTGRTHVWGKVHLTRTQILREEIAQISFL